MRVDRKILQRFVWFTGDGSCVHYNKWEEYKNPQLTKAKEILRKFLDAKSIEETCVAESEAEQFLRENGGKWKEPLIKEFE